MTPNGELFIDPEENIIIYPEFEKNVLAWRRPIHYIHEYLIRKEIISKFPLKNTAKLKKFVYEMYDENSCPLYNYNPADKKQNRKVLKDPKLNIVSKRLTDYTSENKRFLKSLFKVFDKNEFYIVKYMHVENEGQSNANLSNVNLSINAHKEEKEEKPNKKGIFFIYKIFI